MAVPPKDPTLSRKVHNLWISELYYAIKPQVKGRLSLGIDEDVTLIELDGSVSRVLPDFYASKRAVGGASRPAQELRAVDAVAYAEGTEDWVTESRHFLVLRDLRGQTVVAVLEILSPTNKGYYADLDLAAFKERRQRLLSSAISYMEIDAVRVGTRWLPRCLRDLQKHAGVAWSSLPDAAGRRFRGWAWPEAGPLPKVPWDLAEHGVIRLDLEESLAEALATGGIGPPG